MFVKKNETSKSPPCPATKRRDKGGAPGFLFNYDWSLSFSLDLFSSMKDLISLAAPSRRFHCS